MPRTARIVVAGLPHHAKLETRLGRQVRPVRGGRPRRPPVQAVETR